MVNELVPGATGSKAMPQWICSAFGAPENRLAPPGVWQWRAGMQSFLKSIRIVAFILILLAVAHGVGWAEQRLALVIGNAGYSFAPLKNPVNDASDMAVSLQKLGFTVMLKKNVNLREMEEAIQDFGNRLKQGGVGLFYFAGHGLQAGGVNYLVPVGARIDKESDIKYEAVDAGKILDEMADAKNSLNVVILDACRDNPFSRRFRSASRGLAVIGGAPVGAYISYSTSPGQVALDGEGRNSPFAAALLHYMNEPGLTLEQVFKNVRHRLSKETGGKQVPWELSSLEGDFFFVTGQAPRAALSRDTGEGRESGGVSARPSPIRSSLEQKTFKDAATGMEFILVQGGCFQMGDGFGDGMPFEKPLHEVCVDSFYLGKHEVTQGQWKKVMGENPSHFKECGEECPVESVNWTEVQAFIAEMGRMSGEVYRLPTEAEWEFAARSGGKLEKWAGTSSESKLGEYAWYDANSVDRTHPVGKKKPNALGFHDMSGNVWEWTGDFFSETYYQKSPRDNPLGPDDGAARVLRGGCWLDRARDCRSAIRFSFIPVNAFKSIGFRMVHPIGRKK
jgi:formylglycine-generating enzyme required for sulfatase activity